MKKRIFSLLLVMTLVFSMFFSGSALAQDDSSLSSLPLQGISQWALDDLIVGDTYNIYPRTWYNTSLNKPISNAQLRVLLSGVRNKLFKTGCVVNVDDVKYLITKDMTVKDVLEVFYTMLNTFEFNKGIGIKEGETGVEFMAKTGIFTGNEGELSLDDICTIEQACVIAARLITYVYDVLDAASKGFLWEIKNGENTAYLLGSVHFANYDIYPFSNKILTAFAESDALCVEVDILNPADDVNSLYMKYGYYTDGTTLKDHVSEEVYQKTIAACTAIGLPEEAVALMKPWFIYLTLTSYVSNATTSTEDVGLAATLGIDMKFILDAYLSGKPVKELEGAELQLQILDSFSDKLEEYLLVSTIDAIALLSQGVDANTDAFLNIALKYWHDGDVESFMRDIAPILAASEIPVLSEDDKEALALLKEYREKLLTNRDKKMAEKIDDLLKAEGSNTYFIVVGTLHYISDYSVLDILKEMGYEINQIK